MRPSRNRALRNCFFNKKQRNYIFYLLFKSVIILETHLRFAGGVLMNVAIIQMDITTGVPAANRKTVAEKTAYAACRTPKPDVIVLPELWPSGYALERAAELSSPEGTKDADFLATLARQHGVAFAGGSVLSQKEGKIYNRAQLVTSDGTYQGGYDKVHLFRLMHEDKYLGQGHTHFLFTLEKARCACVLCYDIRFCEYIRKLVLLGAEVLFVSAQWPDSRREHWNTLLRARAIENQIYVVACNRCGVENGVTFAGCSAVIAPDGTYLAQAGEEETVLSATLDITAVRRARNSIPVFRDRVPELY